MKIKIIDLLNKIANDEEVPEKIMYDTCLYTCDKITRTYYDEEDRTLWESYNFKILNDEVEILNEAKEDKIQKIYHCETSLTQNEVKIFMTENLNQMVDKINELIDEINNLKRE